MAARIRKTTLSDSWKDKIKVSMLMNRLVDHGDGKIELTNTQVRAIEIVLSKLVPTLAASTSEVTITRYTDHLDRIAALDTHAETPSNEGHTQH